MTEQKWYYVIEIYCNLGCVPAAYVVQRAASGQTNSGDRTGRVGERVSAGVHIGGCD